MKDGKRAFKKRISIAASFCPAGQEDIVIA
jgi:hypothetical protein